MTKSTRKVARTATEFNVSLQRREGKRVAIIEAVDTVVYEDGRGYAGMSEKDRQVMVLPISALAPLVEQINSTLVFQVTETDAYDLETDVVKRIGLYGIKDPEPTETFYTVAEARVAAQPFKGKDIFVIAHLPDDGVEGFRSIIERV